MTFREYIAIRRFSDSPQGDFVQDARGDSTFPDVGTWAELETYLTSKGAIEAAIDAARSVWNGYEAAQKRPEST